MPFNGFYGAMLRNERTLNFPGGLSADALSRSFKELLAQLLGHSEEAITEFIFPNYREGSLVATCRAYNWRDEWLFISQSLRYVQFICSHYFNYLQQPLEWANSPAGKYFCEMIDDRLKYQSRYFNSRVLSGSRFIHNRVTHGICAALNAIGFGFAVGFGDKYLPRMIWFGIAIVLGCACLVNIIWFLALFRWDREVIVSVLAKWLAWFLGKCLMLVLRNMFIPMMNTIIPMLVKTTEQCPVDTYAKMERITSAWYDCLFHHPYTCVPCSGNTSTYSDLCDAFCNSATVSWLKADPGLRYDRDIVTTSDQMIFGAFCLVIAIFSFLLLIVVLGLVRIATLPVYGTTVDEKWNQLLSKVDAPFIDVFSRYNFDSKLFSMGLIILSVLFSVFLSLSEHYSLWMWGAIAVLVCRLVLTILKRPYRETENFVLDVVCMSVLIIWMVGPALTLSSYIPVSLTELWIETGWVIAVEVMGGVTVIMWGYQSLWKANSAVDTFLEIPGYCSCCSDARRVESLCLPKYAFLDIFKLKSVLANGTELPSDGIELDRGKIVYATRKCYEAASQECTDWSFSLLLGWYLICAFTGISACGYYVGSIGAIHSERLSVEC
jgi:hypothetical protein